jgi:hypothetical protein
VYGFASDGEGFRFCQIDNDGIFKALLDSRESFTASSRFGIKDVFVTFDSRQ